MNRKIFITGKRYEYSGAKPFEYFINVDHITYVVGRQSDSKRCQIKVQGRDTLIDTDESFDDVMQKIYSA